jgi:hypothetical protein
MDNVIESVVTAIADALLARTAYAGPERQAHRRKYLLLLLGQVADELRLLERCPAELAALEGVEPFHAGQILRGAAEMIDRFTAPEKTAEAQEHGLPEGMVYNRVTLTQHRVEDQFPFLRGQTLEAELAQFWANAISQ